MQKKARKGVHIVLIQDILKKCNLKNIAENEYERVSEFPGVNTTPEFVEEKLIKFIEKLKKYDAKDETPTIILGMRGVEEGKEYISAEMYLMCEFAEKMKEMPDISTEEIPTDEEFETWDKDRLMKYTADIYAILPQAVGYFLSPWEECLAAETNEGNLERIGIDLVIEAFIQEISFNGMTEESQEKRRNELDESIRNTNEILKLPREEQEEHFHPVEDLFKELGIVDERTKEEKEESIRQIYVDSAKTNARWLREFLLVAKEYR